MSGRRRVRSVGLALAVLGAVTGAGSAVAARAAGPALRLVWHVENLEGDVLDSQEGDAPLNPASVVKVATSLWALERLGPEHRFETLFAAGGRIDPPSGTLEGDLLVFGGADPDFHVDNAYLVAQALNQLGVRRVQGRLLVDTSFWIGWEGGSDRRTGDGHERARLMALRLRDALDPARWSRTTRRRMAEVAARRGGGSVFPKVTVRDGVGVHAGAPVGTPLVVHRSNPLRSMLARFDAYSNNDIERFEVTLGQPVDLSRVLAERWETEPPRLSTLSGLRENRMTPQQIVRLLRDLDATCRKLGLDLEDVLPTVGCTPGTLRVFRELPPGSVVGKTGSLTQTDGGITVFAGIARAAEGKRFFCVAVPGAGGRMTQARRAEQTWVRKLLDGAGGAAASPCRPSVTHSDDDAHVLAAATVVGTR